MDIACDPSPAVSLNFIAIGGIVVSRMRETYHTACLPIKQ